MGFEILGFVEDRIRALVYKKNLIGVVGRPLYPFPKVLNKTKWFRILMYFYFKINITNNIYYITGAGYHKTQLFLQIHKLFIGKTLRSRIIVSSMIFLF